MQQYSAVSVVVDVTEMQSLYTFCKILEADGRRL